MVNGLSALYAARQGKRQIKLPTASLPGEAQTDSTMKFLDVVTSTRHQASISVRDIVAIYDYQSDNSKVQTKDGTIYYCELSREKLKEKLSEE